MLSVLKQMGYGKGLYLPVKTTQDRDLAGIDSGTGTMLDFLDLT
jgi:hypothetical protein